MTALQTIMFWLVMLLSVGTAVLLVMCARTEKKLAARRKINLSNYKEKSYLFYIPRDLTMMIVVAGVAVLTLAATVVSAIDPVIRVFLIPLVALLAADGIVAWLSVSRHKCNRDIRLFDAYYVQVRDLLENKDRTEKDIVACRARIKELYDLLTKTVAGFNQNLKQGVDGSFIKELFRPVIEMIEGYSRDITAFSEQIEKDFDAAMQQFLLQNVQPELHVMPLRAFDEMTVTDLLTDIKTSYGSRVATEVVSQVESGAVESAAAMANIMDLLHGVDVTVNEESLKNFLHSAAGFEDRAQLVARLYANKQITMALVRRVFIPNNWGWTFLPGMAKGFRRRELTQILSDVLIADNSGMCYALVVQLDESHLEVVEGALAEARAAGAGENGSCALAAAYRTILKATYSVGNTGNLFENMALMLRDRCRELSFSEEECTFVSTVCQQGNFFEKRNEIGALYHKAQASAASLLTKTMQIMLFYMTEFTGSSGAILRPDRVASTFAEYRFTLSFADINTLRMILSAVVLAKSQNPNTVAAVLRTMGSGESAPQSGKAGATMILKHLMQNDRIRLRSVIYRTENQRCALDRILALGGKEQA